MMLLNRERNNMKTHRLKELEVTIIDNIVFPKRMSAAIISALLAGLMLLGVVVACSSSSSDSASGNASCTGEVTYEGKTFTGQGKNAEEAQQFACSKYCLEADPEFDAHYGIWLDSQKGRDAGRPPKKEAIYKDADLMNYLTKTCSDKCVAGVKEGRLKGQKKCP